MITLFFPLSRTMMPLGVWCIMFRLFKLRAAVNVISIFKSYIFSLHIARSSRTIYTRQHQQRLTQAVFFCVDLMYYVYGFVFIR